MYVCGGESACHGGGAGLRAKYSPPTEMTPDWGEKGATRHVCMNRVNHIMTHIRVNVAFGIMSFGLKSPSALCRRYKIWNARTRILVREKKALKKHAGTWNAKRK